jgi:hypothetical protein
MPLLLESFVGLAAIGDDLSVYTFLIPSRRCSLYARDFSITDFSLRLSTSQTLRPQRLVESVWVHSLPFHTSSLGVFTLRKTHHSFFSPKTSAKTTTRIKNRAMAYEDAPNSWGLLSGPWNPLGLRHDRSRSEQEYNATPFISIELLPGERAVGNSKYDGAWVSDSYRVAATSTPRASCTTVSQGMMVGQPMLDLHTKSYGQPCPLQHRLEGSMKSAPSRSDEGDSGYAESSAGVAGWLYPNNRSK